MHSEANWGTGQNTASSGRGAQPATRCALALAGATVVAYLTLRALSILTKRALWAFECILLAIRSRHEANTMNIS